MNFFEHEKYSRNVKESAFSDGKVKIPENNNRKNDLLDEARWMMDFMLAMQVPDGKKAWVPVGDQSGHLEALKLTRSMLQGWRFIKWPMRPGPACRFRHIKIPSRVI